MTIDEIIEREKWLAEDHEMIAESYKRVDEEKTSKIFKESAEEHKQLAEWLEDYKHLRNNRNSFFNFDEVVKIQCKNAYNKAIDDFVEKMKKYMETTEQATYIDEINKGNDYYSAMTIYDEVDRIAEQLKEGEQDE